MIRTWLAAAGPLAAHEDPVWPLVESTLGQLASVFAPFFLVVAVAGIGAVVAQVGLQPNPELLLPKPSRLSVAKGIKRLFSMQGAANLVKAVVKIALVLAVASRVVWTFGNAAVAAPAMPLPDILALAGTGLRDLLLAMVFPLAVLAAADWFWQRWRHEKGIRMSRKEVKDEQKESEGDPQTRSRFRRAHRELRKRRMLSAVRDADVVLTNPVHVAVALRYRPDEMAAPRVLAKGAEAFAERIKVTARAAGVPIVERRALARALFRSVPVGGEVPAALYRAVAEILAYIYSLRGLSAGEAR